MQDCRSNNSVISARNLFVTAMASKTQNCNLSMALAVSTEEVQTVRPSCVHTYPKLELQLLTKVDKTSENISANWISARVTFPFEFRVQFDVSDYTLDALESLSFQAKQLFNSAAVKVNTCLIC